MAFQIDLGRLGPLVLAKPLLIVSGCLLCVGQPLLKLSIVRKHRRGRQEPCYNKHAHKSIYLARPD